MWLWQGSERLWCCVHAARGSIKVHGGEHLQPGGLQYSSTVCCPVTLHEDSSDIGVLLMAPHGPSTCECWWSASSPEQAEARTHLGYKEHSRTV